MNITGNKILDPRWALQCFVAELRSADPGAMLAVHPEVWRLIRLTDLEDPTRLDPLLGEALQLADERGVKIVVGTVGHSREWRR